MAKQHGQEHAQPDETRDLIITRIIDVPVALVWKAWNEPDYLMQWWGPEGFTCPLAQMDVRAGGTSLVGMASPEYGTHYSTWHYQEIVPQERIVYIHNLADQNGQKLDPVALGMPPDFPQDQRHTITFRALDDGQTELTITEYEWPVGQMMDMSRVGMEQCLDKLAALVATQTSEASD
jgi:uncharacterized protein YndB with AHSA1/START domain